MDTSTNGCYPLVIGSDDDFILRCSPARVGFFGSRGQCRTNFDRIGIRDVGFECECRLSMGVRWGGERGIHERVDGSAVERAAEISQLFSNVEFGPSKPFFQRNEIDTEHLTIRVGFDMLAH